MLTNRISIEYPLVIFTVFSTNRRVYSFSINEAQLNIFLQGRAVKMSDLVLIALLDTLKNILLWQNSMDKSAERILTA